MVEKSSINKKRIAKNTTLLYVRMLFSMLISLYTSRVTLNVLGIEDFGIYGIVSGVIAMFAFLNAAMSGTTSRFLTFELGKNDMERLKKTFSSAMTIHILIAVIILILGETIGLWFLENKLVIPENRMHAARWVYQLSILNMMVTVIRVPYNASIIAHERMGIYAYIEILNTLLKLGIVYLLLIGGGDKLILYAGLVLLVSVVVTLIYMLYCPRLFEECKYKPVWDKSIIYPMLSFSGWDLYGNLSVVGRTQGVNILLNMFFGPLLNAANTVAIQVQGAVMAFAHNIVIAVRPQIVKSYAAGHYNDTRSLVINTSKLTYLLLLIVSLPLMLEMDFVLRLWLKNVPDYASIFCVFTLMFNLFATMSMVVLSAIHATGHIKRPSLINGTLYLSIIPITYIAFKLNGTPEIPYICSVLSVFLGMLSNAYTLKLYLPQFSVREFAVKVLAICLGISLIAFGLSYCVKCNMEEGFLRFIMVFLTSAVSIVILGYYIAMNRAMRKMVKSKVLSFLKRKSNG